MEVGSESFFSVHLRRLDKLLDKHLPPAGEVVADAMRYATLSGGKRLRPMLVYATAHCLACRPERLDALAVSLELIHCYSLIHDDLPAMDDADLRRGQPSCHLKFGESMAILAGDGLQPLAFGLLAELPPTADPDRLRHLLKELAEACGWQGMVRGQMLDMTLPGQDSSPEQLEEMHRLKTGALIEAAVAMAAIQCGADAEGDQAKSLRNYARCFGLAFQARDDLLDSIGDSGSIGKMTGADAAQDKASAVAVLGIEATATRVETLCAQALAELAPFGADADHLRDLVGELRSHP